MRFSLVLGLSLEVRRLQAVLRAGHPCLPKGHEVWVKVNDTLYFPQAEKAHPIELAAQRVFFLSRSLTSLSKGLLFVCLE